MAGLWDEQQRLEGQQLGLGAWKQQRLREAPSETSLQETRKEAY